LGPRRGRPHNDVDVDGLSDVKISYGAGDGARAGTGNPIPIRGRARVVEVHEGHTSWQGVRNLHCVAVAAAGIAAAAWFMLDGQGVGQVPGLERVGAVRLGYRQVGRLVRGLGGRSSQG
jgi:hypothetical protein